MKEDILFDYLKQLMCDGITTILGATRALEERFDLSHDEARRIINDWNRTYGFTK